jgi:preprotein translocase subunit SecE
MAKKKIPLKYRQKYIMERQAKKERKAPAPSRKKTNWGQVVKKMPGKIAKFFRNVVHELKRVTWPTRKALLTYTVVVLVTLVFFAIILGLFDLIFMRLVELLSRI